MQRFAFLICLLWTAITVAGDVLGGPSGRGDAQPARPVASQPPDKRIGALFLPQVNFREADFAGALEYFRRKAEQQSGGTLKLVFAQDLPKDFRPKHELTLELNNIPFTVALNYLGELAGVQFAIEGTTITAKTGEAPHPKDAPLPQDTPSSVKGSGALAKPAAPATAGNNVYRTTDGVIQGDKSGYVPHRTMGGWSTAHDPNNKITVNCPNGPACGQLCKCSSTCACTTGGAIKPSK
jgi:hypothetical protein